MHNIQRNKKVEYSLHLQSQKNPSFEGKKLEKEESVKSEIVVHNYKNK